MILTRSTFSNNVAQNTGVGGAILNVSGNSTTIAESTISGNYASNGGGLYNDGSVFLRNTIIANSTGGDCVGSLDPASANNLISDTDSAKNCGLSSALSTFSPGFKASATSNGNIVGVDPKLGPLTYNDGTVPTMALLSGSPAIDTGSICPSLDQRGLIPQLDGDRDGFGACDIGAVEKLGIPTTPSFGDVPTSDPYFADIEILYANGFTGGCSASPLLFCPETTMDRAQGAVFMLRGLVGTSYVPPVAPFANPFGDSWAPGPWAQRWAQGMLDQGLTAGCSTSPLLYCPWEQMPRAQAAVFGMRLKEGNAYNPPAATGTVFADITDLSLWYAKWAEAAYNSGILPACGMQGGKPLFCPNELVSRGLGAYMIVRAKNLSMP